MARLTLSTRNARGLVANLYARDRKAQRGIKRVVRRNGIQLHEAAYADCPVGPDRGAHVGGFMRSQLRLAFSEQAFAYEVGWSEEDFTAAGESFYPVYVIFGTRFQAANDFFFPLRDRQNAQFKRELRDELRAAIARGRA